MKHYEKMHSCLHCHSYIDEKVYTWSTTNYGFELCLTCQRSINLKMKSLALFCSLFLMLSCNQKSNSNPQLQSRIDSLEKKLANTYKPGLGEFMSGIQVHHAKLWFAGQNQNWELADFELHEIRETLDDIKTFNSDRPEVKSLQMIYVPLDSLNQSVQQKNLSSFKSNFVLLTTTCNNCHRDTDHGFNVIRIPDTPPFSNQDFKHQ